MVASERRQLDARRNLRGVKRMPVQYSTVTQWPTIIDEVTDSALPKSLISLPRLALVDNRNAS